MTLETVKSNPQKVITNCFKLSYPFEASHITSGKGPPQLERLEWGKTEAALTHTEQQGR